MIDAVCFHQAPPLPDRARRGSRTMVEHICARGLIPGLDVKTMCSGNAAANKQAARQSLA